MKNLLLIFIIQLVCGAAFAQTPDSTKKEFTIVAVKTLVEKAQFPGGEEALSEFLSKHVKYPKEARRKKIEGKCLVAFTVDSFGNVLDVKVGKGVPNCPECDEEAIRVVKSMPQWNPANLNGERYDKIEFLWIVFKR